MTRKALIGSILALVSTINASAFGEEAGTHLAPVPGWGLSGPPPVIPRPAAPLGARFDDEARRVLNIPPAPVVGDTDVALTAISPVSLPTLTAATGPLPPIRLEASYTEPTTLREVLLTALDANLPINISRAEVRSNRYHVMSSVGRLLPNMVMGYTSSKTYPATGKDSTSASFYNVMYFPVFNGGQDVFHLLRTRHEERASRFLSSATINDTLLGVYNKYQDLLLQYALLQVRAKAVEVSTLELQQNEDRKTAGEGTIFQILQSQTRLAQDEQLLIKQQVSFRRAAMQLAVAINVSPAAHLLPSDTVLCETLLVDSTLTIGQLLTTAIDCRPELKQYEELRMAARSQVQEQLGHLLPNSKFYLATNAKSKGGGGTSGVIIPAGNALGGGLISTGGGKGNSITAGFIVNWLLPGMGVTDLGETLSLREQARKTALQARDILLHVLEEVRSSYIEVLSTREEIAVSQRAVVSAREELRVADERVRYGVGTNLELLSAQRDYFDALATQAEAIVAYRKCQAQLLRDTGTISIAALTDDRRLLKLR